MKKKGIQPLPHSAAPPAGFFHLTGVVCVNILKKMLSSKLENYLFLNKPNVKCK